MKMELDARTYRGKVYKAMFCGHLFYDWIVLCPIGIFLKLDFESFRCIYARTAHFAGGLDGVVRLCVFYTLCHK